MSYPCKATHRCQGSLQNRVSIRLDAQKYKFSLKEIRKGWSLWNRKHDFDYDCYLDRFVSSITFCPFCGVKLEDTNEPD